MTLRFEVRNADDGAQGFYWRIKDGDTVLAKSETMHNKADAWSAANSLKTNTAAYIFEVTDYSNPAFPYSWHVRAGNNRLLVASAQIYPTYAVAESWMNYVRTNAPYATVVDVTASTAGRW